MAREYKVKASSLTGTYNAGKYIANSPQEAIEHARRNYADSELGRRLRDVGSFRFYVVDKFDYKDNADDEE